MNHTVRIWDLPTRLFHWLLALSVSFSLCTAWLGGDAMAWHFRSGYVVISLLIFRLIWGFAGGYWSRWARMTHYVLRPLQIWLYVKALFSRTSSQASHTLSQHPDAAKWNTGHSPLGACAVLLMLMVVLAQVLTGLISDDEIAWAGPFTAWVPSAWVSVATSYHKTWGQWIVLSLIALHVCAILAYQLFKGHSLVRPMIHGDKTLDGHQIASQDGLRSRLVALTVYLLCIALVSWAVSL
jgi:cytochrome b